MRPESFNLLKRLVDTPSPSGYEQAIQKLYSEEVAIYSSSVTSDLLGNVMAYGKSNSGPTVMLAAHSDEIGFQVRYINDDGFIYFGGIGGHDPVVTVGQRVTIHSTNGTVSGVLGRRAIHLMEAEERTKGVKLDDLWIDIGAVDKKSAEEVVTVGDCITYSQLLEPLLGNRCTARSFDNKMGLYVVIEAMRILSEKEIAANVVAVSTVQEEIGLRGARTSAFSVDPHIGIATDVCHSMDYPGADKKKVGDIRIGRGPVIARGANVNPKVFHSLVQTAKDLDIPYQVMAIPNGSGTDANAMQVARGGMATGLVSVPLRYMHTPCEVMDTDDIDNAARLMAGFCEKIDSNFDWRPT